MKPITFLGKLYLIPTTLGESDPNDVLPQTIKRTVDFIDDYIVENEKTARKFIKSINPGKSTGFFAIKFVEQTHRNFGVY